MRLFLASRSSFRPALLAVSLAAIALAWQGPAHAQYAPPLPSQTTSQGGVVVRVTPKAIGAAIAEWKFAVALDTHSEDLSDDLGRTAVLVVDGTELKPTRWSGAAPGGHHRDGTLTFAAPSSPPQVIELRIHRPSEEAPRVFHWEGSALR